ncbi:AAA family ATPase [Desulfonatronum parangueonense]
MGFPSIQQVLEAANHLTFKGDGFFIRTNGLWHVLMFLRHKACHGASKEYTFESYDLAQAAFDLNGVTLPITEDARNVYFEPGATQGNEFRRLFRHREGPRQTYLNRIYTGLVGSGPRQPKLFDASKNALPTTVSLVSNWINALRAIHDNKLVLDVQVQSLMTWVFRFGIPTLNGNTAHIAEHLGNGRLTEASDVALSPIPTNRDDFRVELSKYLGLTDQELILLFPNLIEVNSEVWIEHSVIPTSVLGSELLTYLDAPLSGKNADADNFNHSATSNEVVGCNRIFFGPPGTGKSTEIKKNVRSSLMFRTQFHPEYSNADFIGSYRPVVGSESDSTNQVVGHDGVIISRPVNYFAFVPGPLTLALESAFSTDDHVFLVIEEINRGDCAAIFGDVFQLLDRDDAGFSEFGITPKAELVAYFKQRSVKYNIAEDDKLYFPSNLSLLATMNTSDQSLFPMDSAFKRRWQWVACPIDFNQLLTYTDGVRPFLDDGKTKWDWIKIVKRINKNIVRDRMEDKQLGPWFIKPARDGLVSWDAFLNKCLFYLWHDVFKDEQLSDLSPFNSDGPEVFGEVQANIRENGLQAGFKPELLIILEPASGFSTTKVEQASSLLQAQN